MKKLLSFAFLFSVVSFGANAAALHWQLNGVVFSDGGRVFGGFDYDAGTGTYSNINLTTTPGSIVSSGNYYNSAAPYAGSTAAGFLMLFRPCRFSRERLPRWLSAFRPH